VMPTYRAVELDYEPFEGPSPVFARTRAGFSAATLGKVTAAADRTRQAFFERQLHRLADCLNSAELPVWVEWRDGRRNRMDKGCVGHAAAAGVLQQPVDGPVGIVETVILRRSR
jgi:hypothetical protein